MLKHFEFRKVNWEDVEEEINEYAQKNDLEVISFNHFGFQPRMNSFDVQVMAVFIPKKSL